MYKQNQDVPAKRCNLDHFEKTFVQTTESSLDSGKAIGRSENNIFVKLCKSSTEKVLAQKNVENAKNVFEAGSASLKVYYYKCCFFFLQNVLSRILTILLIIVLLIFTLIFRIQ